MKTKALVVIALVGGLFCSCGNQKKSTPPVSIVWEMGQNGIKPGCFESTFYIKNIGETELKNNWVIYYNQSPITPLNEDSAQLTMERIASTYHKIYPSEHYKPIAVGETFEFKIVCRGSIIKETYTPAGAYIVFTDEDGNELQPQNIELKVTPFEHAYQWNRPNTRELPYPDGNYMYTQNAFFDKTFTLDATDIFPSPKFVAKSEGTSGFYKSIVIESEERLENEANLLKEKLSSLFGFTIADNGETVIKLTLIDENISNGNEFYHIDIKENTIEISASHAHGIFNGCQTLLNIVGNLGEFPAQIQNMQIVDYPDLAHRGLMLDVCRNFTTKQNLLKLIDLLASYKINVLHLHITEDEAWRLEIPGLEELTQIGARRGHTKDERECLFPAFTWGWDYTDNSTLANGYYTREDFIEILKYAAKRHIKVIPEVDLPGHARAAIKAMNARYYKYIDTDKAKAEEFLLADFADTSKYSSAQSFTDNVINVAMPSTYRFVEKVIDEIDKMYADAGLKLEIFHVGGDEVPRGSWEGSGVSRKFMEETKMTEIRDLKDYFVAQVLDILNKRDIQFAAWQEVALLRDGTANERFANSNILNYCWTNVPDWKTDEIPYKLTNAGYPIILANVTNFYMDMAYSKHQSEPGLHWGGFVNEFNSFDVLPYDIYKSVRRDLAGNLIDIENAAKTKQPLAKGAHTQIKGAQAILWAETIRNFEMIEYYLFPKMFGLIERAWNANPSWAAAGNEEYEDAKRFYNAKISQKELPRLAKKNINFRIEQPGIIIKDGLLYANTSISNAVIYYTTDGTEPTSKSSVWTEPVACDAKLVKAKTFYLGKQSVTTRLEN